MHTPPGRSVISPGHAGRAGVDSSTDAGGSAPAARGTSAGLGGAAACPTSTRATAAVTPTSLRAVATGFVAAWAPGVVAGRAGAPGPQPVRPPRATRTAGKDRRTAGQSLTRRAACQRVVDGATLRPSNLPDLTGTSTAGRASHFGTCAVPTTLLESAPFPVTASLDAACLIGRRADLHSCRRRDEGSRISPPGSEPRRTTDPQRLNPPPAQSCARGTAPTEPRSGARRARGIDR